MTPTAPLWTTRRLRCRDGTGTYVRLSAAAFAGLQCKCAAAARPAAAGRLSGMKIEPKKCVIFMHRVRRNSSNYADITHRLRRHYAKIMQSLHKVYANITQRLRRHYADITQTSRNSITQHYTIHYAILLHNCITQLNYAMKMRRNSKNYTIA